MSYYQITAPLSDDERTTIVSAGFRSLDEGKAKALGQGIENAGAKFKYAIIARNQLDDMETARRMRRAAKAFAEAIEALGLPSGSNTSAAPPGLLDDYTRSFRPHLFGIASAQAGTDGATGRAQASEQLDHCVQSVELLHAWTEQAARRLEFAITRPKRQPEQRVGLSRATMGRRARGAETRADNALEHFLRDTWEIYFLTLPRGVPKTSVGAPGRANRGKASGRFIRFCRASIEWVLTQVPSELIARDAKLREMQRLTADAVRARIQRAIDVGTMRR